MAKNLSKSFLSLIVAFGAITVLDNAPAWAESLSPGPVQNTSINALTDQIQLKNAIVEAAPYPVPETSGTADTLDDPRKIAQSAPEHPPEPVPTDLTPVRLPERNATFTPLDTLRAAALYRLPARMFFSVIADNSVRLETNVFQTLNHNQPDGVYRVLPNVTVGYALTRRTRVAANGFFFRDQYFTKGILDRNTYSVGVRVDHDVPISDKSTLTFGFFARELFFNLKSFGNARDNELFQEPLNDLMPSVMFTRNVGYASLMYAGILGQIRFRDMVGARFQEGDQFYSIGGVWRKRPWTFWTDLTLDSNFGNSNLRGGHNNQVLILTLEAARRLSRRIPVSAFVQAQPIFNMGANSSPGFAGVNFRLFGGLRMEVAKPPIFPLKLASK